MLHHEIYLSRPIRIRATLQVGSPAVVMDGLRDILLIEIVAALVVSGEVVLVLVAAGHAGNY